MDCVADLSFAACWFVKDEVNPDGLKLLASHESGDVRIHAPDLWHYEAINFLLMCVRRKRLAAEALEQAKLFLDELHLTFHDQADTICRRRIFHFAEKYQLTAYDSAYLELATRLQVPLCTVDDKLASAAKKENLATTFH